MPNAKRYAYGIDTSEKTMYLLISQAAKEAEHGGSQNQTVFATVTAPSLYYINHVGDAPDNPMKPEPSSKLVNGSVGYWFSDDTRFLGNRAWLNGTGTIVPGTTAQQLGLLNLNPTLASGTINSGRAYWENVVKNSPTIEFKVHYMNADDTDNNIYIKTRDVEWLRRGFLLGDARIEDIPDFRIFEDNPNAVVLRLGYFGYDNLGGANTPTGGEYYPNYLEFTIPIARFDEEIEFVRQTNSVRPINLDSKPETGTYISAKLLQSIQATYTLRGVYTWDEAEGGKVYREVPPEYWRAEWFTSGDLRNYSEEEPSMVPIEFTIKTNTGLLSAGFAAYVGIEGSFEILAIPNS
jgi:hypothetical protein